MKNKSIWQMFLAIIMLAGIATYATGGQQAATAAKPAQSPAKTSRGAPPSIGTASKAGASSVAAAEPSTDTVVMKVGDTKVTKGDIDFVIAGLNPQSRQALAMQGRKPLGDQYATLLVLSRQALNDHLESAPDVRQRIELQRRTTLASAEFQKLSQETQATPDEVTQYFSAHQPDFEKVDVREFFIRKRPANSTDVKQGLTVEEARTKASAIRQAVLAGADIKKVAEQFNAPNVVNIDTVPRPVERHALLPALDEAAFSLKDNEVSQPLDLPQGIVLLQVTGHAHPQQKEVATEIETKLKQEKLQTKLDGLKKQAGVWMDEQFFSGPPTQPPAPAATPRPTPPQRRAGQAPKR